MNMPTELPCSGDKYRYRAFLMIKFLIEYRKI